MSREPQTSPTDPRSAAEWFVALDTASAGDDSRDPTGGDDARAAAWMDESADNDAALARCAAAVAIARGLADDPQLRWAYDEAAAIASGDARARGDGAHRSARRWLAWTGAGVAAAAVAAALVLSLRSPPPTTAERPPVVSHAAEIVARAAPVAPVVLLPGGVAVDANSVAVLPFAFAADDDSADADGGALLQNAIVADLAAVPGVYVRGGAVVAPYAHTDLSAAEIGVLLGTRGIVSGQVELHAAGVSVHAQLTDAATNDVVWRADYDTTLGELRSVSAALVDGIAATLVDPTLRRSALRAASSARGDNTLASVAEPAFDR
ncbi:MAG TPA: hypothetical protein VE907_02350 [Gammaproteobacteria bacterium]|nr:hypothetical protein [Gammaproteobacteria bacterium]